MCFCLCPYVCVLVCVCTPVCAWMCMPVCGGMLRSYAGTNANSFERTMFLFRHQPLIHIWTVCGCKCGLSKVDKKGKEEKRERRMDVNCKSQRPVLWCFHGDAWSVLLLATLNWPLFCTILKWSMRAYHGGHRSSHIRKTVFKDRRKSFNLPPITHNIWQPISPREELCSVIY